MKISLVNLLLNIGSRVIGLRFFEYFFISFLWTGIIFRFFWSLRKISGVKNVSNINFKGFALVLPHTCILRKETLCFGWIQIFYYKRYNVFLYFNIAQSLLYFVRKIWCCSRIISGEHFKAKKLLKTLAVNVKFEHTESFNIIGEIFGILFLP